MKLAWAFIIVVLSSSITLFGIYTGRKMEREIWMNNPPEARVMVSMGGKEWYAWDRGPDWKYVKVCEWDGCSPSFRIRP